LSINPFGDDNGSPSFLSPTRSNASCGQPWTMFQPAGGWCGGVDLAACLDHIENNSTGALPKSLRERAAAGRAFVM
jgi:hypothetical protein